MAHYLYGERIGREASIRLGCSAVLLDAGGGRVLLTRRTDNGRWCLPGGGVDAGESVAEAVEREVWEETGLRVRATRLLGVYSSPDMLVAYADGNRFQLVALNFVVEQVGGELRLSDETTEYGFFGWDELEQMDIIDPHVVRLRDVRAGGDAPYMR
ncbi:NUDIX domain-containing protein [Chloroflexia bacterium SDU3-3]|nr:NUDIX domain-containing protein [Chloroflexia bacterium SDU3-3]